MSATASSSSGDPSSHSSQSQSIPSSMDSGGTAATLPTQDAVDGMLSDEEEHLPPSWGRLFPLGGTGYKLIDLINDEYKFGRGSTNSYRFDPTIPHFQALSTNHFKIYRKINTKGEFDTFITDLSSNGTFLNGDKVGRNKTHVLNHNDEISLSVVKNKAYIFQELGQAADEIEKLPEEMRQKYTLSKTLGRGACGEVKLAFTKGVCKKYAVKLISKKQFSVGPKQAAIKDEVDILKAINHPCIIRIEDVFESPDMLYIVLELVEGGELFDRVNSVKRFEEPIAKLLFYQMVVAVEYLHSEGITHRDLKPENVLLSSDKNETLVKITDFGLSKMVGEQSLMKTLCGTESYLAPEVLQTAGLGGYSKAVDCWSLGVILYICLSGIPPFYKKKNGLEVNAQIIQGMYSFPKPYWNAVSDEAIDLIKKLMTVDAKDRLSLKEALQHPWLKDEAMIEKATELMYSGKMPPPAVPAIKKRSSDNSDDGPERKREKLDNETSDNAAAAASS